MTNITRGTINGAAWSLVQGSELGSSLIRETEFQTGQPTGFTLPPGQSRVLEFCFPVPASLNNGARFCTELYLGRGPASDPGVYYNVLGKEELFCITKGSTDGFALATPAEARAIRAERAARQAARSMPGASAEAKHR